MAKRFTRRPQKALSFGACGFESHPPHLIASARRPAAWIIPRPWTRQGAWRSSRSCARSRAGSPAPMPSGGRRTGSPSACAGLGRRVDIEPTYVHPQSVLVQALHCLVAFAGSLAAISSPAVGFALVLLAATSMYLDLNYRIYLFRALFFRRGSQNVVVPRAGPGRPRAPGDLRAHGRRAQRRPLRPAPGPADRSDPGAVPGPARALPGPVLVDGAPAAAPRRPHGRRGLERALGGPAPPHPRPAHRHLPAGRDRDLRGRPGRERQRLGGRHRRLARCRAHRRPAPQPRRVGRPRRGRGVSAGGHALIRAQAPQGVRSEAAPSSWRSTRSAAATCASRRARAGS